jgi:ketosteroid isomerase-like protein
MTETEAFLADMMPRLRDAERALHNGDAEPRYETWSHAEPVTLFGAWLTATGWQDVSEVFRKIAARFSDSASGEYELIAAGASGDLAYTVGYEHTVTKVDGVDRTYTLRATQVYRREDGVWKVVHRHGDELDAVGPRDL